MPFLYRIMPVYLLTIDTDFPKQNKSFPPEKLSGRLKVIPFLPKIFQKMQLFIKK